MKKKEKEFRQGDVVKGIGIIKEVDLDGKSPIWTKPNFTFWDYNDAYYGPCSREMDPEKEWEVETERSNLIRAYNVMDGELAKFIADKMQEREEFNQIHHDFFTRYNKEHPRRIKDEKTSHNSISNSDNGKSADGLGSEES